MKHLALAFFLFIALYSVKAQDAKSSSSNYWPLVSMETKPWTRWWWMGSAVKEDELLRLLKEYEAKGFGGVEITPIYGVKGEESESINFLSPEWINMLTSSIGAAGKLQMGVDMNTGTGWPFGGPHITLDHAAKTLSFYSFENPTRDSIEAFIQHLDTLNDELLLALSGVSDSGQRVNMLKQRSSLIQLDQGNWSVYAACEHNTMQMVKRAAPGGEGLVFNHFSLDATQQYLDRFDAALNGDNHGIRSFFNDSYELTDASSSVDLFEVFLSEKGYDLSLYLKELSGEGNEDIAGRIKADYRDVLGSMLLENFTREWTGWAHGLGSLTRNQAHGSPGNLIDLYSEVDIPEVETFHANYFPFLETYINKSGTKLTESMPLFRKFAPSAAHMRGQKLVSCETFTWLNEHFKTPLYQCKPELDNLFAAGVNHIVFHGTTYSPEEATWPGWLFYASMHMQAGNPQWTDLAAMNRYITRCQSILQSGVHTNDFLVYWSPDEYNHQADGLEKELTLHNSENWIRMPEIDSLNNKGYQFDFVSDRIIAHSEAKGALVYTYGKVPYKAVVVPYLERIRLTTFKNLLQLAEGGATIVFRNMPELVSGYNEFQAQEEELAELIKSIKFVDNQGIKCASYGNGRIYLGELQQALSSLEIKREILVDYHLKSISRRTEQGCYYFLANHEKEQVDRWLSFKHGSENALFLNPMNGEVTLAESSFDGVLSSVYIDLEPGASTFIYFTQDEIDGIVPQPYYREGEPVELSNTWHFKAMEGVPELPPEKMLMKPTFWSDLPGEGYQHFSGTAAYSTHFFLDTLEFSNYLLRFERVEASARIFVNEQELATLWSYPFEVDVTSYIKEGKNELRVEVSNLGANGIRYLDQQGENWKKFYDINLVDLDYKPFNASAWEVQPSGISGKVVLLPRK
ncbi:MAG: glycoside hydrolase [Bacteroidetes bacterium]|nr:MAG: glycoside hydrolase [Bacteroidota bacterium]